MKARRWVSLGLVMSMALALLAGCGSSEEPQSAATASPAASAAADAKQTEPVKIKLALWDYGTVTYDKRLVEEFTKQYPNIQVEVISVPNQDYANKLAVMLAGGEDIDVFYAKSSADPYANLVLKKFPMALDDLIAKDNIDLSSYGALVDLQLKIDDQIYGIPYRNNYWLLYYNKDLFDQANVPYPTNDMTWEEVRELAKKMTAGEGNDKIYGLFNFPNMGWYSSIWAQKHAGFDLNTSDLNLLKPGIQMHLDIQDVDKSAADYASNKSINADQLTFEKGKSAMMYNGSWFINMLMTDKKAGKFDFNWGVVKMPYWEGGEKLTFTTSTPVCINAKTKKLDAAWTLLKFITGEEGAKILAEEGIQPGYMSSEILDLFNQNPDIPEGTVEALSDNTSFVLASSTSTSGLIQTAVQQEVELVITHNKSLDQAIEDAAKRREEIVEQNK